MANIPSLLVRVRDYMDETTASYFTDAEITRYLNEAHQDICSKLQEVDDSFLSTSASLSIVSGTASYDLPVNFSGIMGITVPASKAIIPPLRNALVPSYSFATGNGVSNYYIQGLQVKFLDTPTSSETATIYYKRLPTPLSYGAPAATASATTLTLAASPTGGENVLQTDYYVGSRLEISSGTGIGQIRRITAFNSSTRKCTVASAWATNPLTTSVYSFLPDTPKGVDALLILEAALRCIEREGMGSNPNLYARRDKLEAEMYTLFLRSPSAAPDPRDYHFVGQTDTTSSVPGADNGA